jgi:4-diphosphocytidyl-2-C-methyl-D-erythritol kinase
MNNLRNIPAPAKLNLFLHVVGQRDDGYHLLETFFDLIDWNDTLSFDLRTDGALVLATPLPGVPPQLDLCVQAAALLAQYARTRETDVPGVTISVEKQLPIGGGIGGGSSDAATTLMALNRLWKLNLPRATLSKIGLALGADVPIFIQGLPSWASGIGEKIEPSKNWQGLWYVVLAPDTQVPTSAIFSAPELTRDTKSLRILGSLFEEYSGGKIHKAAPNSSKNLASSPTPSLVTTAAMLDSKATSVATDKFAEFRNDLQAVAMQKYPKVACALEALKKACSGMSLISSGDRHKSGQNSGQNIRQKLVIPPRMTGSGACVFAGFSSEEAALAVAEKVKNLVEVSTVVKVAKSLKSHPLRDWGFAS